MPDRLRRIEELYHRARTRNAPERSAFLDEACAGDVELRREVESLLAERSAPEFLETPAFEAMAAELAEGDAPIAEGMQFGSYTILSLIGRGGMGEVYRARDAKLERDVAVKALPFSFALDPDRAARFDREARLLASLNHPNIATIHGVEESGGRKLLVLELVEGETLGERLARGAIPADGSLKLAVQIAEALEAAHEKGIVHRDLKPANIHVTAEGRIKVLDFGLAKALATAGGGPTASRPSLDTAERGLLVGTAAYMAPEQARGEAVDRRADIWAFGCVLFEMLTGRSPFGRETVAQTVAEILGGEPGFDRLPPETPLAIRRLIRRCLAKDSRERLQHIGDARVEIREALSGADSGFQDRTAASPASSRRRFLWTAGVGAAGVVGGALGGALGALRMRREPPDPMTRFEIGPFPIWTIVTGGAREVAISRDGRLLAYGSGDRILLRSLEARSAETLAEGLNPNGSRNPFFSPDGEWLAFFADAGLYRISVNGGAPRPIVAQAEVPGGFGIGRSAGGTWSADGTIVFATRAGLFQVAADGGEDPERLTWPSDGVVHAWPCFIGPEADAVVFTIVRGMTADAAEIAVLDRRSGEIERVHTGGTGACYVRGGFLAYATAGGRLAAIPFDPASRQVRGGPKDVPGVDVEVNGAYLAADFAVSDTGTLVNIPPVPGLAREGQFVWVDHSGAESPIEGASGAISYARVSPQGDRLALNMHRTGSTERRIWVLDLRTGRRRQLSAFGMPGPFEDMLPQWSPDGRQIYFSSNRAESAFRVYWVDADGSGTDRLLSDHEAVHIPFRIRQDGRMLFGSSFGGFENSNVGMLHLDDPDSGPEWVLNEPYAEVNPILSPDGRWIAYESNQSGRQYEIDVRPFPDTGSRRIQVSVDGGRQPLWDPLGRRQLYYRNLDGDLMAARYELTPSFQVGDVRTLFRSAAYGTVSNSGWSYDISPVDGRFLIRKSSSRDAFTTPATIEVTLNWGGDLQTLFAAR